MITVNAAMNLITNAVAMVSATMLLLIGLLVSITDDEEGGMDYDDANH